MKLRYLLLGVLAVFLVAGAIVFTAFVVFNSGCREFCPGTTTEASSAYLLSYSGFQVARQYPNPSTWNFTLHEGTTSYITYEYNVTKGLDVFVNQINGSWEIWQTYRNGSSLLAEIRGSVPFQVQYIVLNEPSVFRSPQSYTLGVQLTPLNYTVNGQVVRITWSVTGLYPGTYPVDALDLDWHNFIVVPQNVPLNITSVTFSGLY
jgi:hypothetical protein